MTKQESIDATALSEKAQGSIEKEAYVQLKKTTTYRLGVGARAKPPNLPSFFVEVIINLSPDNRQVDLLRLENSVACLKLLKARGYTLTYEDDSCISCETTSACQDPNEEYKAIKALIQKAHL